MIIAIMVSYADMVRFKAVPVPTMHPVLHWGSGRPMPTEAEKDDDRFFWNIVEEAEIGKRRNRLRSLKFKEVERPEENFPLPKVG